MIQQFFRDLPRDAKFLMIARGIRAFAFSYSNVVHDGKVESNERGSAAGVTRLARIAPFGISPTISTYLIQTVSLTLPCSSAAGYSCSMRWHSS